MNAQTDIARMASRAERYRRLFDMSPQPQILTGGAGIVLDSNAAAQALGREFVEAFRAQVATVQRRPGTELRIPLGDGSTAVMKAHTADAHLELLWIGRTTPFSSAEAAEAALVEERAAREKLEAEHRGKDHFLSVLSHDLRGPISVVLGWTQLLRRELVADDTRERALCMIERSARVQLALVEELLDLSRISRGQLRLEKKDVDLRAVVRQVVEGLVPDAIERRVTLAMKPGADRLCVHADRRRIEQIVTNLIANALKFTRAGGRVDVDAHASPTEALVRVCDDGRGIARELLPHVFDCFRQDPSDRQAAASGLGLGLFIVRHLVEQHGGTVVAESDGAERGATFTVRLPVAASVVSDAESALALPPEDDALAGLRVLVVEDERDASELLTTMLRGAGAEVVTAEDGRSAADRFEAAAPDVLVSDIGLPDDDGCVLLRTLRKTKPDLPAVAVSGFAAARDADRTRAAGFACHLAKPVDAARLVRAIRDAAPSRRRA